MVLRVALVELLPSRLPDSRPGGHEDAWLRAVGAGLPGAFRALDPSVCVQFGGRLPVVPDVAGAVLRVPVGRSLGQPSVEVEAISNDRAAGAGDHGRLAHGGELIAGGVPVLHAAVDESP